MKTKTVAPPSRDNATVLMIMKLLFFWQSVFFLTAQFLGIFTAVKIGEVLGVASGDQVSKPDDFMPWKFLLVFAVILAVTFFLIKLPRGKGIIFKTLFILTVWWGASLVLSLWIPDVISLGIIAGLLFIWSYRGFVLLHDILVVLGIAGIAGVFGLRFAPETIIFLLIIFAVYDVIAVYKTKHMIKLAKSMMEARALFAVIAPEKTSLFFTRLKDALPGKDFMMLGGGDIAFPLMLASSVAVTSIERAFIVVAFSFVGLFSTFVLFFALGKKPMPALPPIAIMAILGFVVSGLIVS